MGPAANRSDDRASGRTGSRLGLDYVLERRAVSRLRRDPSCTVVESFGKCAEGWPSPVEGVRLEVASGV